MMVDDNLEKLLPNRHIIIFFSEAQDDNLFHKCEDVFFLLFGNFCGQFKSLFKLKNK
jgi:hypothetical protein